MAGGLGVEVSLRERPATTDAPTPASLLFSESPTRFLLEVRPDGRRPRSLELFDGLPIGRIGDVIEEPAAGRPATAEVDL